MSANGGPAFPRPAGWNHCEGFHDAAHNEPQDGMSLRDWFAGQALAGIKVTCPAEETIRDSDAFKVAISAYAIADAMLQEREGKV